MLRVDCANSLALRISFVLGLIYIYYFDMTRVGLNVMLTETAFLL